MEKTCIPFAVSGIAEPDKIRALVYANNQIAHVSLSEVLKTAVRSGKTDAGRHIRFLDGTTLQFGYTDQFDNNGYAVIALPVPFQDALYVPLVISCGDVSHHRVCSAVIDSQRIDRAGFAIRMFPPVGNAALPRGCGVYWLAAGC